MAKDKTLCFNLSIVAKPNVGPLLPQKSVRMTSTYEPKVVEDQLLQGLGKKFEIFHASYYFKSF